MADFRLRRGSFPVSQPKMSKMLDFFGEICKNMGSWEDVLVSIWPRRMGAADHFLGRLKKRQTLNSKKLSDVPVEGIQINAFEKRVGI